MNKTISLGEFIDRLHELPDNYFIKYDFGRCSPRSLSSWRGIYSELSLGFDFGHTTVKELQKELQSAVGKTFWGWKGGEYVMSLKTPVWMDNEGEYTKTKILSILDDKYQAIIITEYDARQKHV